jgi:hypothetical protein
VQLPLQHHCFGIVHHAASAENTASNVLCSINRHWEEITAHQSPGSYYSHLWPLDLIEHENRQDDPQLLNDRSGMSGGNAEVMADVSNCGDQF